MNTLVWKQHPQGRSVNYSNYKNGTIESEVNFALKLMEGWFTTDIKVSTFYETILLHQLTILISAGYL